MSIVNELSSEVGDKTEEANRNAAKKCIRDTNLLRDIAEGLKTNKAALVGDCAEVLTKVAEEDPQSVVPYAHDLIPLLTHKTTRVRWEAMHAIAFIASYIPEKVSPLLPRIKDMIQSDSSTIVRDYAIDTVGNYAKAGENEALLAYPILKESLLVWDGKHRGRVLKGFTHVLANVPSLTIDLRMIAEEYKDDKRGVVKKVAKDLIKDIDKG